MACHTRSRGGTQRKRGNRVLEVDGKRGGSEATDELPVEPLKIGLNPDQTVLQEFHRMIDAAKVNLQYIRDEEDMMLRDPGRISGRWARFFGALFNANSDKLRVDTSSMGSPSGLSHALSGWNPEKTR